MVSLNRDALNDKVLEGARISSDEALQLYQLPLEELGALANVRRDLAKEKSYGGRGREIVTYIADRNINYTNVCNVYCKFCAFYRTERDEDHYVLSLEQIDQKLDELSAAGGVQILMQGGTIRNCRLRGISIFCSTSEKISADQYPRIQSTGVSAFRGNIRMPLREVIAEFKKSRAGIDPRRRRRNSGRPGAQENFRL